jgi:hypothetical protein
MSKEHSRKEIEGIDQMTSGKFDRFMDGARKVAKYILPVLGATLMAGCNADLLDAIARTAQAPEVSPLHSDFIATQTEVVTEMPILDPEPTATVTETREPAMTQTPEPTATTEVLEEKHIFLTENIGYGDYQFDFEISLLNDDEIIKAAFEKYGIESASINEEKINARELLAKTIIFSFVQTYNLQNGTNVSMDEYMANPTNYPTMINMLGNDGKQEVQAVTIDKIKKFDLRYTSGMEGELYMNFFPQSTIPSGYSLDNDKFILYTFMSTRDPSLEDIASWPEELDGKDHPYLRGLFVFTDRLFISLGLMQYTTFSPGERADISDNLNGGNIFDSLKKTADAFYPGRMSIEEFAPLLKEHQTFFKVD